MTDPRLTATGDPDAPPGIGWDVIDLPGAPFTVARLSVAPGCTTPIDSHAVTEVWVVARGSGELRYDGAAGIRLTEGDAVRFVPPRTHQLVNDGTETMVVHSVYWLDAR
ncbi:hypothetical protein Val02_86750 [Virgisporangium aliadipatigenens]|uniref:Cupin type-2 domain-containing protein n=1 Tax=Virgisporangium aliadipatigenens TaxID=741659 RepID=A0A8J4DVG8_9ACTN|nr:cupin domain-containing protein [Virgisporangium aliadipatigenens]GIJ51789.1 hypothetical protein Val02_86750 [Virgisporangium aliadipatigenens]